MNITNNLSLPEPFVQAVKKEYQYKPKRYSVTEILKGSCQVMLERRFSNTVDQDVSDMIWLILGTAVHKVLENAQETDDQIKEGKIEIPVGDGYVLSGIFDLYDAKRKTVTDYKTASCWKVIFNDWSDYRKQLLMYAYMLRKIGFECDSGEIIAILKDHSKMKAKIDSTYPQYPVYKVTFNFTDDDFKEIEEFINQRFDELKKAEKTPTEKLIACSREERWATDDKYAVMKKGKKAAVKLCDTEELALQYIVDKNLDEHQHYIEYRAGENKKCNEYCSVSGLCPFYQSIKKATKEEE